MSSSKMWGVCALIGASALACTGSSEQDTSDTFFIEPVRSPFASVSAFCESDGSINVNAQRTDTENTDSVYLALYQERTHLGDWEMREQEPGAYSRLVRPSDMGTDCTTGTFYAAVSSYWGGGDTVEVEVQAR